MKAHPTGTRPLPASHPVTEVLQGPGRSLEAGLRSEMQQALPWRGGALPSAGPAPSPLPGRLGVAPPGNPLEGEARSPAPSPHRGSAPAGGAVDLSSVRVHSGPSASRAAHAIGARAFAVGEHVVLGARDSDLGSPEGRAVLSHELTHVLQHRRDPEGTQGLVQRVGLWESIVRFFGGGTFSRAELEVYLETLRETNRIEDRYDSDNKARAVVAEGLHAEASLEVQALLIQEMLSGFVSGADEDGILGILRDAPPLEREQVVGLVGSDRLQSALGGSRREELLRLLAEVAENRTTEVPTHWQMEVQARGAEELRQGRGEDLLVDLTAEPAGGGEPIQVAAGREVRVGPGTTLAEAVAHPLGRGGRGHLQAFLPALTPGGQGIALPRSADYQPAIDWTHRRVSAHLALAFSRERTAEVLTRSETERGRSTTTGSEQRERTEEERGTSLSVQRGRTEGARVQEQRGRETGRTEREGRSTTTSTTTRVRLQAAVTPEIAASLNLGAEGSVGGGALGLLLGLAGPKGLALGALLSRSGALDSVRATLTGGVGLGYTLTLHLEGEVAREWTRTVTEDESLERSQRRWEQVELERSREESRGAEAGVTRSRREGTEEATHESETRARARRETTGRTTTEFVPVLEDAELTFRVHGTERPRTPREESAP